MKFSVLLPTRNRLKYLTYAIDSVLKQDYNDWEIAISDNDSEENIEDYIHSLNDPRIKYYRTESFCPVTDNWNNAVDKSSGDYVIMLGDDDCLLDGYFSHCLSLIQQHDCPEMIYCSAYTYTYPGILQRAPQGELIQFGYAPFLMQQQKPFILDKSQTLKLVHKILNFNVAVNFNMQHSLVSRRLVQELQKYGKFYQSPYPDYYATTALLLKAKRILAVPEPLVVIGVCPKSFGCAYWNNQEKQGVEFLGIKHHHLSKNISKYMLSGTDMNISWLIAMEAVFENFGREYALKVGYTKFRLLQILQTCRKYACHEGLQFRDMVHYIKDLFLWELIPYFFLFLIALFIRFHPDDARRRVWGHRMAYHFSHPSYGILKQITKPFANIMEVFEELKIK